MRAVEEAGESRDPAGDDPLRGEDDDLEVGSAGCQGCVYYLDETLVYCIDPWWVHLEALEFGGKFVSVASYSLEEIALASQDLIFFEHGEVGRELVVERGRKALDAVLAHGLGSCTGDGGVEIVIEAAHAEVAKNEANEDLARMREGSCKSLQAFFHVGCLDFAENHWPGDCGYSGDGCGVHDARTSQLYLGLEFWVGAFSELELHGFIWVIIRTEERVTIWRGVGIEHATDHEVGVDVLGSLHAASVAGTLLVALLSLPYDVVGGQIGFHPF